MPAMKTDLTRRKALGLLAGTGAAVAASGTARAQAPQPRLTLLLVNDIYKLGEERGRGGYARLAAIVKAERARGVPLLFAHAGDCFSPSLMSGFDRSTSARRSTPGVSPSRPTPPSPRTSGMLAATRCRVTRTARSSNLAG
ncbi:MAG: hypothetical protein NTZ14_05480 [Hyphomicrobiales bacterium]|nr:hypothetical protein [Hyphomicrobiales bacterium]